MSTEVIGVTLTSVNPSTQLLISVPVDAGQVIAQEGDLLLFAFIIMNDAANDATDFRTALPLPTGWQHAGFTQTATNRVIWAFKYVELDDPTFYAFTYLASTTMAGIMFAVRGAARSWDTFTPVFTPPNFTLPSASFTSGFFAPAGSVGAVVTGTSTSLTTVSGSFPHTVPASTRVLYVAMQIDQTGTTPLFDDPVPLPTLRQSAFVGTNGILPATLPFMFGVGDTMTVMAFDVDYTAANQVPPPAIGINSNLSRAFVVSSIAVEAFDVLDGTEDNYKGKLMRGLLKHPWDTSWGSGLSDVLTVIGSVDNDIGGLFGSDDFLPNGDKLSSQ